VLVVDDDPDIREVYSDMLGAAGFEVVAASDGAEAMRILDRERPAAIVLDMMMPGDSGAAFRTRQRACPEIAAIPIVVVSARALSETDVAALAPQRYLIKPIGFREFVEAVESAVAAGRTCC
jgi:CheY-like chemotaxis protein